MKKLSTLFIIIAGIFWGCMGVFSNELNLIGFNSLEGSAIRITFCALILALTNIKKLKIDPKDIWQFVLIGIFSILTMSTTYFESIKRSSLTVASILLYTAPIMVTVMSFIFYKEKITLKKFMCLLCAVLGIVMISGLDKSVSISYWGLFYGLMSGFSYALYSIIGKMILKKYDPITVSAYAFIFAALGSLLICDVSSVVQTVQSSQSICYTLLIMIGCAVITAVVPYGLYTLGLKYVPAGKASILACVEPLTASLIGITFYGDKVGVMSLVGIVFIILSVVALSLSSQKS